MERLIFLEAFREEKKLANLFILANFAHLKRLSFSGKFL